MLSHDVLPFLVDFLHPPVSSHPAIFQHLSTPFIWHLVQYLHPNREEWKKSCVSLSVSSNHCWISLLLLDFTGLRDSVYRFICHEIKERGRTWKTDYISSHLTADWNEHRNAELVDVSSNFSGALELLFQQTLINHVCLIYIKLYRWGSLAHVSVSLFFWWTYQSILTSFLDLNVYIQYILYTDICAHT